MLHFLAWQNYSKQKQKLFFYELRYDVNAIFNNISVISWRSVVLMDKTGENHRPITSHLSHAVLSITPHIERDSNSQLIVEFSLCQILKHYIHSIFLHKCTCCVKFYFVFKYNIMINNNIIIGMIL